MIRVHARLSSGRRTDKLHRDVLSAMGKAVEAANPRNIIRTHVTLNRETMHVDNLAYPLGEYRRIFVVGAGKASGYMADEIEKLLGNKIAAGLVIVPDYLRPWPKSRRIEYWPGTHPTSSEKNVQGVIRMLELSKTARRDDLVVTLLSGGASALMEYPLRGLTLRDERKTTDLLLKSGANIQEINSVRKHVSRVKGGRLAEILRDTHALTLVISDVVGDQLDAIGSGPTVPDPTTYKDAKQVLQKYNLWSKVPVRIRKVIGNGIRGVLAETPKEDKNFGLVKNVVIGSNRESCYAVASHMKKRDYGSHILSTGIVGEARQLGRILGSIIKDVHEYELFPLPLALISGGETTVNVKGNGKGGRNQELALAAAITIEGSEDVVVGSIATDGVDGPTDAAGALVDGTTVTRGRKRGMDPRAFLENNDSYGYLSRVGDLVKTGPTGTNVNDIMIIAAI